MKRTRKLQSAVLLLVLALTVSACGGAPLPPLFYIGSSAGQPASPPPAAGQVAQAPQPTVAPADTPTLEPTATATEVPPTPTATTAPPTATPTSVPPTATATSAPATATPTRVPATATPTRAAPTATPTARPTRAVAAATPTPEWPQEIVITEQEVEELAASGGVPGLTITGLDVTFGDDTMSVFFSSLRYGFISLRDVTVDGHFDVSNGSVTFVADSISPRNLATTQIPGFVNQALGQQFTQWYVEDVTITPGQLSATVRPR